MNMNKRDNKERDDIPAAIFAPELNPANSPSSLANLLHATIASSSLTSTNLNIDIRKNRAEEKKRLFPGR